MTLAEQIAAVVTNVGGQTELVRLVRAAGGALTQPRVSALIHGQRPDLETLSSIARATGCEFRIGEDTGIGESRQRFPSDGRPKKKTRGA